ncbi:MAG: accessory gene regulator B family protein [Bacillota bacterium]|nr:accessory gene regulator B family protein [Bacillota bacterium]
MKKSDLLYEKISRTTKIEDDELFYYGLEVFKSYLLFISISFLFGGLLGTWKQLLSFLIFFTVLHRYTGGFHFQSRKTCFLVSQAISIGLSYVIKYIKFVNMFFVSILFTLSIIIVFFCKTVDSKEKRITKHERAVFTKKAIIIEISYYIITVLAYFMECYEIASCLCVCVMFCTFQIILNKLLHE